MTWHHVDVGSRREKAQNLIALAEDAIAAQDLGQVLLSEQMRRLEVTGIPTRIDREIRKAGVTTGRWMAVTPAEVTTYGSADVGLLLILASHTDGFVREAVIDVARDPSAHAAGERPSVILDGPWMVASRRAQPDKRVGGLLRSPGVARMLAQRALDHAAAIRSKARSAIRALFEVELQREPRGWMFANVEAAAREVVARPAAVELCPELVDLALDLFASSSPRFAGISGPTHHQRGSVERHRHTQLLRHLRLEQPLTVDPIEAFTRQRLIDWHDRALGEIRSP